MSSCLPNALHRVHIWLFIYIYIYSLRPLNEVDEISIHIAQPTKSFHITSCAVCLCSYTRKLMDGIQRSLSRERATRLLAVGDTID